MNLSREDIAGIIGLSFLFAMGAWSAIGPKSAIRYFLKKNLLARRTRLTCDLARVIGIVLMILSVLTIAATLKTR
jgi:hypothetical protein